MPYHVYVSYFSTDFYQEVYSLKCAKSIKKLTTINISCLTYLPYLGGSGLKWAFSKLLSIGLTGLLK